MAKPDFAKLLRVGACTTMAGFARGGRSGSSVGAQSLSPSPKQTIWHKIYTNSSNSAALDFALAFSTPTNKSNITPILNVQVAKIAVQAIGRKPDFAKLLRVGAWGRASRSRVEAQSTTPSPKQTI